MDRRVFIKLSSLGAGAVFASGLPGVAAAAKKAKKMAAAPYRDFYFVQMSDCHWGYTGPANPESATTLKRAVEAVNALEISPEFIVFTGDLTHTTDDPVERRRRMVEFKEIVGALKVKDVHFMPGEHDASLDHGAAFQELFGETHYVFDHQGVHFIVLDNVSDPGAALGAEQLDWLKADLAKHKKDDPIVVYTHRPLFDLAPQWDWATRDGAAALEILSAYDHVTVFYGHIHQEHHFVTGKINHHAARSLIFPLPVAGSQERRTPLPWDANAPLKGLGFREVEAEPREYEFKLQEYPVVKG
jgi:hypothetical protein